MWNLIVLIPNHHHSTPLFFPVLNLPELKTGTHSGLADRCPVEGKSRNHDFLSHRKNPLATRTLEQGASL